MRSVFCEVLGAELKLAGIPRRIISLSPAATETLFELGLGENIVGVSAFCVHPAEVKTGARELQYSRLFETH